MIYLIMSHSRQQKDTTDQSLVDDATCHRYESLYNGKCNYKTIEGANHNFASAFARAELDKLMLEFLTPLK